MTLPRPYSRRGCTASLDFDRVAASNGHGSQCCIGVVSLPLSAKGGVLAASRQARLGRDGVAGPLCVERLLCFARTSGPPCRCIICLGRFRSAGTTSLGRPRLPRSRGERASRSNDGSPLRRGGDIPPVRDTPRRMSDEDVALVHRMYEVINAIGRTGEEFVDPEELAPDLWARLSPDFEMHGRPDVPDARVYRGREATKEFWPMLQEVWAELRWEPRGFTDLGRAVVVETRI